MTNQITTLCFRNKRYKRFQLMIILQHYWINNETIKSLDGLIGENKIAFKMLGHKSDLVCIKIALKISTLLAVKCESQKHRFSIIARGILYAQKTV